MKRYISLILVMFFLFSSIGHAADYGIIKISMKNNKIDVTQVPIIMDGKEISTDTPSFVHDHRTLVPIRFIEKSYGAEVIWEQETQSVIVKYKNDNIRLTIDSSAATINGEKRLLDKGSIPRLVTFADNDTRTMVPLSFLAEALGFDVGWDYENKVPYINSKTEEEEEDNPDKPTDIETQVKSNIISNINVSKGSTDKNKIIIESNKELNYEAALIEENLTFVIDIKDAKVLQKDTLDAPGIINVNDDTIKEVRYSQFSDRPDITRIVIFLKEKKVPNIMPRKDGTGLMISFESYRMESITKEVINGEEAIVLNGADDESMNIIRLKNPERLVIDFLDTILEGEPYVTYPYDLGFIKGVRVSQFKADNNYSGSDQIVRVVLDIKDGISDPNVKIDSSDNKVVIYPEKSFWENISYEKIERDRHFILNNLFDTSYKVDYDNITKTLEVRLPTETVELNDGLIIIKDELLDGIIVEKGEVETSVSLQFKKSIEFFQISNDIDNKVHLVIRRNNDLKPKDRLIVIDPGHGGKDPGAISVTKKTEKDFNLTLSLKLDSKLKALGYNTLLTRETDVFIDLYDRPRMANELNADIFISIHANANNSAIAGIEVFHWPTFDSEMKAVEQMPLAKSILDGLIKSTGAKSRGLYRKSFAVIRESKMPAVLVEAGYLTNVAEERLLFTEEYQNKVVDGLVLGIEDYFEID